jgi:predicted metal-dependent HD superfamily phosphohydrolase
MQRWVDLFPEVSLDCCLYVFRLVDKHYNEAHRHYHTQDHIADMLEKMDVYFPEAPQSVVLAVFLHDVVYQPGSPNNELNSARFAVRHLGRLGLSREKVRAVARAIMATRKHVARNRLEAVVCDLDLLSLACEPARYHRNTRLLRQEFGEFTDAQWNFGRNRFINSYLGRKYIYASPKLRRLHEANARRNLQAEASYRAGE